MDLHVPRKLLDNVRVTAEILYHLPDHPLLLQTFIWQDDDLIPELGKLKKFLSFWETKLEGSIRQVRYVYQGLVSPAEIRFSKGEFRLH